MTLTETSYQPDAAPGGPGESYYPDLLSFYTGFLAPLIRRRDGGGRRWCAEWWRHAEVVARLTALWHAWEALRLEPGTGMSTWWTYHFEPCFSILADAERGPFQACDGRHKDKLKALPHTPLPSEWIAVWSGPDPERSTAHA